MIEQHYGDLRAHATQWWALQRSRIRLELTAGAAKKAGWGTADNALSIGLKALRTQERVAERATVAASVAVYPAIGAFVAETMGLGDSIALFVGLLPPLRRLEDFPGFPCPTALWTYCGLIAEKRAKFDRRARMLAIAYIAWPAILRSEIYHGLYAARRERTTDRGWTKMHAHRDAIRYVAKRILLEIWQRRLPVGPPDPVLSPQSPVTAVGAAPSIAQPTSTRLPRENPHEGVAPALESDALPLNGFTPTPELSAPESDLLPEDGLLSDLLLSAPGSVLTPELLLAPFHHVTTPEP